MAATRGGQEPSSRAGGKLASDVGPAPRSLRGGALIEESGISNGGRSDHRKSRVSGA